MALSNDVIHHNSQKTRVVVSLVSERDGYCRSRLSGGESAKLFNESLIHHFEYFIWKALEFSVNVGLNFHIFLSKWS